MKKFEKPSEIQEVMTPWKENRMKYTEISCCSTFSAWPVLLPEGRQAGLSKNENFNANTFHFHKNTTFGAISLSKCKDGDFLLAKSHTHRPKPDTYFQIINNRIFVNY